MSMEDSWLIVMTLMVYGPVIKALQLIMISLFAVAYILTLEYQFNDLRIRLMRFFTC